MKPIPKPVLESMGCATSRAFKARKRAELKAAIKALNRLRIGCAFFPDEPKMVRDAQFALDMLTVQLAVKNWGR